MENWILQGRNVSYDDATHTYIVDGRVVPSVTQVMKMRFGNKYNDVPKEILERASVLGKQMHEAIELYEQVGIIDNEIEELRDYMFLKKTFGFENVANEKPILIIHNDLIVAGRLDQVLMIDNELGLNDFKRTSVFDKEYLTMQLNLYRIGYGQTYGVYPTRLFGTWLRKGKRKFQELKVNEAYTYELLDEYMQSVIDNIMEEINE